MLLQDAANLAESRGDAHLVVVVGDIAYSAKDAQYKLAGEWLDQLTKAVKCGETNVRVVPGNHDCDEAALTRAARNAHRTLRDGTVASAYADLEDAAKGSEEANPFLPKLKAYREFAAGYDSDFESASRPLWTKDVSLAPGVTLQLVGMNSVQVSDPKSDQAGNMILGNSQYTLSERPELIYMAIMHHPLDWYMDKALAKQYLYNRARVLLFGHEHVPYIQKANDSSGNERLEIYSGATSPPETGALYTYAYNWIEISPRERAGSYVLAVNVFPRTWMPVRTRFAADTERAGGRESVEFEIACPFLKPKMMPSSAVPARLDKVSEKMATETSAGLGACRTGGETMADEEIALAKLKFLFWRHLDWRQRLTVLVQADALPSSADQPLPQTMERLAIDSARQRGKLADIWDAMMPFVPAEKRKANPFAKVRSE